MPPSDDQLRKELVRILDVLDGASIPHFLTGALARNALATSRTSEDFDIVLDMRGRKEDDVRMLFERAGYRVEGPLKGNLGRRFVLDIPDYEADLWLAPDTEIHRAELERARPADYHGRRVRVMHPEDFVLRKLVNWRRIRHKPTDLDDAYAVLLARFDEVDSDRLVQRAAGHRVDKDARELVELVREDREKLARGEPLE